MSPSVCVIILAYREPAFLNGLLASLAQQTLPPAEILIVDDASGEEFTRQYQLPENARLIVNPHNIALAAISRNIALRQATGEFIALIDQDDRWHPEKLAIQAAALAGAPAALLHYTHLQEVDEQLQPLSRQPHFKPPGGDSLAALLKRNSIAYSSVMLRRTALDRAGPFDETIRAAADWDMWLRIAALGTPTDPAVLADPRPLLLRRQHGRQWSKATLMMAQAAEKVMAKACGWVPEKRPGLRRLVQKRHARWLRELARARLDSGEPGTSVLPLLRRVARQRPLDPRVYGLALRALFAHAPPPPGASTGGNCQNLPPR